MRKALIFLAAFASSTNLIFAQEANKPQPADNTAIVKASDNRMSNADTMRLATNEKTGYASFKDRMKSWRSIGQGLGGGPQWGIMALNMRPLEDMMTASSSLKGQSLPISNNGYAPIIMVGGMGFLGIGQGFHIGGGGWGGERRFFLQPSSGDSVTAFIAKVNMGGFLIEKAFVNNQWDLTVGSYLGGGAYQVSTTRISADQKMTYNNDWGSNTVSAHFTYFELHGACTYSLTTFIHLGAEISLPAFISSQGFDSFAPDFVTVNPMVQLSIIIGNLG